MIIQKALLSGAIILFTIPLFSRSEPKHELSLTLGLSNYIYMYNTYSLEYDNLGYIFGVRYTTFFHEDFGFMTGIESSFYHGNLNSEDYF